MLYEQYEKKVAKIARFLKFVLKHLTKILISAAVVTATTVTLVATKGLIVSAEECPQKIEYGTSLDYSASAFLSSVYYEYCADGENVWTTDEPRLPGIYKVRPVGKASFGGAYYGAEQTFEITPKTVNITFAGDSYVYGDVPKLSAPLAYSDKIVCEDFNYDYKYNYDFMEGGELPDIDIDDSTEPVDYRKVKGANVSIDPENIRIVDAFGNDVTAGYVFTTEEKYLTISPRPITVTFDSAEKSYDGKALSAEGYKITSGSLAYSDMINIISSYPSIINAGNTHNLASFALTDEQGNDLSSLYDLNVVYGTLTVTPAKITVVTGSLEVKYDGNYHNCRDYTLEGTLGYNEQLVITNDTNVRDVSELQNLLIFEVSDSYGANTTDNYAITYKYGVISVIPRSVSISSASESWIYDGTVHMNEDYTLSGDGIVSDESLIVTMNNGIFGVGSLENTFTARVINSESSDVTNNYEFTSIYGTLTVTKRHITVTTPSDSWVFDDTARSNTDLVIGGAGLPETDEIVITGFASITDVGSRENQIFFYIYNDTYDGSSPFDALPFSPSSLVYPKTEPYPSGEGDAVSYSGDVTYNYEIEIIYGTLTVTPAKITVISESASYIYNGYDRDALYVDHEGFLAFNHYVQIDSFATIRNIGSVTNEISVSIINEYGENETSNYEISYRFGTIEVTKRPITVMTSSADLMYDGTDQTYEHYDIISGYIADYQSAEVIDPSMFNVIGTYTNKFALMITDEDGNDVTYNYDITYEYGSITIFKREVTISSATDEKVYDGTPLENPLVSLDESSPNTLAEGHYVDAFAQGSIINVGSVANTLASALIIRDADGNDVTENYDPTYIDGYLTVHQRPITITSGSGKWVYNDEIFSNQTFTVDNTNEDEGLAPGHKINAYAYASIIHVGQIGNAFSFEITDAVGNPVDHNNYAITVNYGNLEVTPRIISVVTASESWVYDAKIHFLHDYELIAAGNYTPLVEGHTIVFDNWAQIINRGTVSNDCTYVIHKANGEEVEPGNYEIDEVIGSLTITPRKITVTTEDLKIVYDGYYHTPDKYTVSTTEKYDPLAEGHVFSPISFTTVRFITNEDNVITYEILDENGDPVDLYNYEITEKFGQIIISKRAFKIVTEGKEWTYDGIVHTHEIYELVSGGEYAPIADNEQLIIVEWAEILNASKQFSTNSFAYYIEDAEGTDTTFNYDISFEWGKIRVNHRKITVTTGSESWEYDGKAHTNEEVTVGGEGLAPDQTLVKEKFTYVTDVTKTAVDNVIVFTIEDADGNDVSTNYEISETKLGKLEITARKITVLTGSTGSAPFVYDGDSHYVDSYEIIEGSTAEGHSTRINTKTIIKHTNAGFYDNVFEITILDEERKDRTYNYDITYVYGTVEIEKRAITVITASDEKEYDGTALTNNKVSIDKERTKYNLVSGHRILGEAIGTRTDAGVSLNVLRDNVVYIVDANGNDVSANYDIEYILGTLIVYKREITVYSNSDSKKYDGQPLSAPGVFTNDTLPSGHTLVGEAFGKIVKVGSIENEFTAAIYAYGEDVSDNFIINRSEGTLEILPLNISLESASASKKYDGTPLTAPYMIVSKDSEDKLLSGNIITANVYGSVTTAQIVPNYFDPESIRIFDTQSGEDVTSCYNIVSATEGTLEIYSQAEIVITTYGATKEYDGTPLTESGYEYVINGQVGIGTQIIVEMNSSLTEVGIISNEATVTVLDEYGNDITGSFIIVEHFGNLEVKPISLTLRTGSDSWVYDGEVHDCFDFLLIEGDLLSGHELVVKSAPTITDASSIENKLTLGVVDSEGNDVTHNYDISYEYGTLEVTRRPITVTTGAGTHVYDDTEYRVDKGEVTVGSLVKGQKLSTKAKAGIVNAGYIYNDLYIAILSGKDDVTHNYDITVIKSIVTVIPRPVIIASATAGKVYDGTPLTAPWFEYVLNADALDVLSHHEIVGSITGSQTNIGSSPNYIDGSVDIVDSNTKQSVIDNYNVISVVTGVLTVTDKAVITVTTPSVRKEYDGTPLTATEGAYYTVTEGILPEGVEVIIKVTGEQRGIGYSKNTAEISLHMMVDGKIVDVTDAYAIDKNFGTLTIYARNEDKSRLDESGSVSDAYNYDGEDNSEPVTVYVINSTESGLVYLKRKSFGDYNLTATETWLDAPVYDQYLYGNLPASYLASIAIRNGGAPMQALTITPQFSTDIVLPYYTYTTDGYLLPISDAYVQGVGSASYTVGYYGLDSFVYASVPDELADFEEDYREFVYQNYTSLDYYTRSRLDTIITSQGFYASDSDIIEKVAAYVRSCASYNKAYPIELTTSDNQVVDFLFEYNEGVCRHFASAATAIYRALGIPARYTIGYAVNATAGRSTVVTSDNAHAWVEVYIDGCGWIPVEVTGNGGDIEVVPVDQSKVYDGDPLKANNEIVINSSIQDLLERGYTYEVTTAGERTEIGISYSRVTSFRIYDKSGADVTHMFSVNTSGQGELRVVMDQIHLYIAPRSKSYDGTPIGYSNVYGLDYVFIGLPDGVEIVDFKLNLSIGPDVFSISSSDINANIHDYVSFKAYVDGEDVTDLVSVYVGNYADGADYTVAEITPAIIRVATHSATKEYDGKPLIGTGWHITEGKTYGKDRIEISSTTSITNVGTATNDIQFTVVDENGYSVDGNYIIKISKYGTLTVTPEIIE